MEQLPEWMEIIEDVRQRSEVIGRIHADVDTASSLLSLGILTPLMYVISGIGATLILASCSMMLCLAIYLVGMIALVINMILSKISRGLYVQTREATTSALSVYMQSVSDSALIKTESLSMYVRGVFSGIFLTGNNLSGNGMSVADMVMASWVGIPIVTMITSVSGSLTNLQRSLAGINRIFRVLELEEEEQDRLAERKYCVCDPVRYDF